MFCCTVKSSEMLQILFWFTDVSVRLTASFSGSSNLRTVFLKLLNLEVEAPLFLVLYCLALKMEALYLSKPYNYSSAVKESRQPRNEGLNGSVPGNI